MPEEDGAYQAAGRGSSDLTAQAGKGSYPSQGNDKIAAVRGQMRCAAGALVFGPRPGRQACCCDLLPSEALVWLRAFVCAARSCQHPLPLESR